MWCFSSIAIGIAGFGRQSRGVVIAERNAILVRTLEADLWKCHTLTFYAGSVIVVIWTAQSREVKASDALSFAGALGAWLQTTFARAAEGRKCGFCLVF